MRFVSLLADSSGIRPSDLKAWIAKHYDLPKAEGNKLDHSSNLALIKSFFTSSSKENKFARLLSLAEYIMLKDLVHQLALKGTPKIKAVMDGLDLDKENIHNLADFIGFLQRKIDEGILTYDELMEVLENMRLDNHDYLFDQLKRPSDKQEEEQNYAPIAIIGGAALLFFIIVYFRKKKKDEQTV
ncbi:MAG: hypothetical protein HC896_10150 [Bacteroidales bacterium]|nr:hypothetical protein [Bacteroidales bacterium]